MAESALAVTHDPALVMVAFSLCVFVAASTTLKLKQVTKSSPAEPVHPDPNRAGLLCLEDVRSG